MNRVLLILGIVVAASGCLHPDSPGTAASSSSGDLRVESMEVSDKTLAPGQNGVVTLKLRNYHKQPINIQEVSIYNTGKLEKEKLGCSPDQIEEARDDFKPGMECRWRLSLPEGEQGAIESRIIPVKLNLVYESELSNSGAPVKIHMQPASEIERVSTASESFSNGEVRMSVETESPVPVEQGRTVELEVKNTGPGRVEGNYEFEYLPQGLLSDCPEQPDQVVDSQVTFTCEMTPGSRGTRNLIFSTSYKYVKAPTIDIEVVNNE